MLFELFAYKFGSDERGKYWERITESLSAIKTESISFKVTQRSVRDRYNKLEKNHKKKTSDENKQSGISTEQSEKDIALDDIIERFRESSIKFEEINAEKAKSIEKELSQAKEMRDQSLETFTETRKRKER